MTSDQFVTRELYLREVALAGECSAMVTDLTKQLAAMVAERDALAAQLDIANSEGDALDSLLRETAEERNRLQAQLAAAHGLQARAERAEAALAVALLPEFQRCSVDYRKGHLSYAGQLTEWHKIIDAAAVPS